MDACSLFLLRTLLLLWVICVVVSEHSKGDVRRVIIKDRIARNKRGHRSVGHSHSHHGHAHSRGRDHSGRKHNHGHKTKGKKHRHSSEESGSFEDSNASFSRENSLEDQFHSYKTHKSHRHQKTSHRKPSHPSSSDYETSRPETFKSDDSRQHYLSDWVPLSSELSHRFSSHEHFRDNRRKRKHGKNRKDYIQALKPPPVEITTAYPFHLDTTLIYPQLGGFGNPYSNWNINQKLFQSNPPLIGTIEHPIIQLLDDDSDRLKNHRYEIEEHNSDTFIRVPEESSLGSSEDEPKSESKVHTTEKTTTTTVKPNRNRGRGNYRGNMKH